mgnify:FL=1
MWNFWVKFELKSFDIIVSSANYLKYLWVCVVTYSIKKVFWRQRVTGEDMKTCENNLVTILSEKKILFFWWFLSSEISKKCHFISPQNGFPPTLRWCKIFLKSAMKTNKNSCESWDIGLSNAPTLMSIRLLEKSVGHFSKKKRLLFTL